MFKTFLVGILLGIGAAAGALYAIPAVDQHREASIISVAPNGGNSESFHINIPNDRVMSGAAGTGGSVPAGLKWPSDGELANISTEMFKVRNARNTVIGVAARTVAKDSEPNVIDWLIHIPARGSLFVNMEAETRESGIRIGRFRGGSREFAPLTGFVSERWVADSSGDEDAPLGRIELMTRLVGSLDSVE